MIIDNNIFQILLLTLFGSALPFLYKKDGILFKTTIICFPFIIFLLLLENFYFLKQESFFTLIEFLPGLALSFGTSPFGVKFAILVCFLWFCTSIYALGYLGNKEDKKQQRFFCFFTLSVFSTLGAAFSSNIFTLYCFYEFLSLSTIPLVMHNGDKLAYIGGRKYITYLIGTSIAFALPALILCYLYGESLNFSTLGIFGSNASSSLLIVVSTLFFFGFSKAAIFPFHSWLPAAMVAPTPVSAMLHAVCVVKLGVFAHYKVVTSVIGLENFKNLFIFNVELGYIFCIIVAFTIVYASLVAIGSDNFKRRLAFSTISKLNYMLLALYLLVPLGVQAFQVELFTHAISKIVLFFVAGAVYLSLHETKISLLHGAAYKMPITFACFLIAALSIIGLPPGVGFYSKLLLLQAMMSKGYYVPLIALIISAIASCYYLFDVFFKAMKKEELHFHDEVHEAPVLCLVPICLMTLVALVIFIFPSILFF